MLLLALLAVIYLGLALVGAQLLPFMSAPVFALLVYVLPLVLTALVVKFQRTNRWRWLASLISPALAILFYIGLAKSALASGAWSSFVANNTMSNSSISLNISSTPLDVMQLLFVSLVFYGVSLAGYVIISRSKTAHQGGRYA